MSEAEIAVIGSCLVEARAISAAMVSLKPEHFEDQRNGKLFNQIVQMHQEGLEVDVVTVWECLPKHDQEKVTRGYLAQICEQVPSALHVGHYASIVKREYYRRRLEAVYDKAKATPLDSKHLKEINDLWNQHSESKTKFKDLGEGLLEYMAMIEERAKSGNKKRIFTGYASFDSFTGGNNPGQLITVGARTSRGKTTFLLNLTERYIMNGRRVLFYSAEMGYEELVDRMVSSRTRIPLKRIREQPMRKDLPLIANACGELHNKELSVNDGGSLTLEKVRAGIEAYKPEIVMVDYIQRFSVPPGANRAAFFSDVANELKSMARDKNVLIFASSQLSRGMEEKGKERRPTLADLKESGGIEEASDIVILLHSKQSDDDITTRKFEFIFAKQRNGPLGSVQFVFIKNTVSFEEMTEELEGFHG